MNQKNLNYEIETGLLVFSCHPLRRMTMNQKNLNYEIETRHDWRIDMNQKNLNYEIETHSSYRTKGCYESKESQL